MVYIDPDLRLRPDITNLFLLPPGAWPQGTHATRAQVTHLGDTDRFRVRFDNNDNLLGSAGVWTLRIETLDEQGGNGSPLSPGIEGPWEFEIEVK
jgi:hypothetical protein